jgi:hypothetical protein
MRVELITHPGCPNTDAVRRMVRDCMSALGVDDPLIEEVGEFPSPTLMIGGADVVTGERVVPHGRSCRLDLPTRESVILALQNRQIRERS